MSNSNDNGKWPLPEGWVEVALGDVAHIERGITFPASAKANDPFDGGIACLRTANVQDIVDWSDLIFVPKDYVRNAQKLTRPHDILISMANSYELVGKVSFVDNVQMPSTFGGFIAAIRASESIDPKFLFYFLRNKETQAFLRRNSSQTVNIANISLQSLYPTPVPLPPKAIQHRLISTLDQHFTRLDAAVAALRRARAGVARYRAAVLKAAVEGRLVPPSQTSEVSETSEVLLARILTERRRQWEAANPKKRYVEPKGPDVAGLPGLPEGWVWARMEQLADVISGVAKGRKFGDRKPISLPYLRVANVQQGYLDLSEIKTIDALPEELATYRLKPNDLVMTEGGDWDKLGRSAIWHGQIEDCIHQNHIFRARPYLSLLPTEWLMIASNSEHGRAYFADSSKQTTNLASINLTQLRAFPVPLPPVHEMRQILAEVDRRLSVLQSTERAIAANLARAERLRQAVLGRAFRGELATNGKTLVRPQRSQKTSEVWE